MEISSRSLASKLWRRIRAMPLVRGFYRPRLPQDRNPTRLHLGCGYTIFPGWINTDILLSPGVAYLDVRKRFPFPGASVDVIYCEEFIEHFSQKDAFLWLKECHRVLRDDGRIGIGTPGLREAFTGAAKDEKIPVNVWEGYGHKLLYSPELLEETLELVGFRAIARQFLGVSPQGELCRIEAGKPIRLSVEAFK